MLLLVSLTESQIESERVSGRLGCLAMLSVHAVLWFEWRNKKFLAANPFLTILKKKRLGGS